MGRHRRPNKRRTTSKATAKLVAAMVWTYRLVWVIYVLTEHHYR